MVPPLKFGIGLVISSHTYNDGYIYLSMVGFKLRYVSKGDPGVMYR